MTKPSESQKNYIRTVRRRRRTVQFMRLFLFLFFVILWEVAAEFSWIDSFIFSSPLRIAKTAWQMLQDGSLTMHIGVTLSETLISFALVVICGILLAILLWMLPMVSEILEPALVVLNSLPKSALAPLLIVCQHQNDHSGGHVGGCFRDDFKSLYLLFAEFTGERETDLYAWRNKKRYASESRAAWNGAEHLKHYESQHRTVSGRCRDRGIYRGEKRTWLFNHLRLPGV